MSQIANSLRVAGGLLLMLATASAQERFDMKVRNDFFAGFGGDTQRLERAMKMCEDELANNPKNAEALVWHGAGVFFQSGQFFRSGDAAKGQEFWVKGLKEMEDAVQLAPNRVSVRVPRGAVLLTASRFIANPERTQPLITTGVTDFESALKIQEPRLDTLGTHPRGELLIGLADGYARLGKQEQAQVFFERIRAALPGTPYAASAAKWLETKTVLAPREAGCLGCHVAK